MVDASPSHACMGGGGELWETARLGRPRRREPAIDSSNASRAEKASKSQESRRRAASFPSARGAPVHAQPSNLVSIRAGVGEGRRRLRLAVELFASFPSQKIQWVGWIMAHITTMDVSGFPSLGRHSRPSRNMSHGRHQIQQRRRHFTSAGPARRYAWRPRPLPASIKCRSPTWRVAQRRPPTTTQAKTTTDTE